MNDLLTEALRAHGGLDRWQDLTTPWYPLDRAYFNGYALLMVSIDISDVRYT